MSTPTSEEIQQRINKGAVNGMSAEEFAKLNVQRLDAELGERYPEAVLPERFRSEIERERMAAKAAQMFAADDQGHNGVDIFTPEERTAFTERERKARADYDRAREAGDQGATAQAHKALMAAKADRMVAAFDLQNDSVPARIDTPEMREAAKRAAAQKPHRSRRSTFTLPES